MLNLDDLPIVVDLANELILVRAALFRRSMASEFPGYEKVIGLVNPDERFRRDLAFAVGKYITMAGWQASQVEDDRAARQFRLQQAEERKREAAEARDKLRSIYATPGVDPRLLHEFKMEAFKDELVAAQMLDDAKREKGKRGRPAKDADKKFVEEMAALYQRVVGKRPTIVTNDVGYAGPFVELIETVGRDVRELCRELDRRLGTKTAATLSANLGRHAKSLRMNKKR